MTSEPSASQSIRFDYDTLLCPHCGGRNLHLREITHGQDPASDPFLDHHFAMSDRIERRVTLIFWCEGGPHEVAYTFFSYKGETYAAAASRQWQIR